ncbi:MAG: signal recognition particle protein [Phenylobacterium sp.]|uniref:signal recognition particle protein n=1 Tax=Phenylobacterium sp. TaxID=1871053 RepID=UPI001A5958C2|nr:signal recognition particle protein [Phenylobacterium sp.]MBL8553130.1 signal recognition particle protein [Phenylobacterium sp.]
MFDALTDRLTGVFDRLSGKGVLSEKDVTEVMREIRVALLEADVALPVVRDFIAKATEAATGEAVIRSVRPADQVVKITYDGLVEMLGGSGEPQSLNISLNPPTVIMMAGLQGSGKTTTAGKLALRLVKERKKVLLASLDTRRPAAMEQLGMLAEQAGANFLPIVQGQAAADIARRAMQAAKLQGFDILILDTAGRTTIDEAMMAEAAEIAKISTPSETLLVADALTGQDAVRTAKAFHERLPLTGLVLTRADGDGRGGAALSMRAVTGLPIKFLGVSEKIDGLDAFDADRVAGRILGRGDVVALVEKAAQELDIAKAEATAKKLAKGQFDLDMMADQLAQMKRMGGMEGMMGLLPGVAKMKKQIAESGLNDKSFDRQMAIISSMTKQERKKPDILAASRKRRIAAGSGVDVAEVNRLLKQHRQMADAFKALSKNGGKGFGQMARMLGGGNLDMGKIAQMTGQPAPTPEQLEQMQAQLKNMPGGLPKLPGLGGGGLPPGFNPFKK